MQSVELASDWSHFRFHKDALYFVYWLANVTSDISQTNESSLFWQLQPQQCNATALPTQIFGTKSSNSCEAKQNHILVWLMDATLNMTKNTNWNSRLFQRIVSLRWGFFTAAIPNWKLMAGWTRLKSKHITISLEIELHIDLPKDLRNQKYAVISITRRVISSNLWKLYWIKNTSPSESLSAIATLEITSNNWGRICLIAIVN